MVKNRGSEHNLQRAVCGVYTLLLCLALAIAPGLARADDGSGSKDNGGSQQKIHFIVGPVTQKGDPNAKNAPPPPKDNKQGNGGGGSGGNGQGSQHH